MDIGNKIKGLRVRLGLTQEELGDRTELSKGFISQLERNLTSPSIATLIDILEALGTNISDFFSEDSADKLVFSGEDMSVMNDEESGYSIRWLVPNAQKNSLEPILVTLAPGGATAIQTPHEGEEFGYVLAGSVVLHLGQTRLKARRGDSFCFKPNYVHYIENSGKSEARIVWVATPPSF